MSDNQFFKNLTFKYIYKIAWMMISYHLFLIIIAYFLEKVEYVKNVFTVNYEYMQTIVFVIYPMIFILCLFGGNFYFRFKIKKLQKMLDIDEKLQKYFRLILLRWGLSDVVIFVSLIVYLITSKFPFIIAAIVIALTNLILIPTKKRTSIDLDITQDVLNKYE